MKEPYTKEEKEVADLLIEAHNKFIKLKRTHPSEMDEWIVNFHRLQKVVGFRILRRDYPDTFYSIKEKG